MLLESPPLMSTFHSTFPVTEFYNMCHLQHQHLTTSHLAITYKEILTYSRSVFICSLSGVACYTFKRIMNVHKPTAMGVWPSPSPRTDQPNTSEDIWRDTDEPTRTLTYSCGRAGRARLHASPASPGLCGLMRCSVLKGSLDRYQIRSGKKGFALCFWGFDRWSIAELFSVTVTPRAYCKDIKGPMGGAYQLQVWWPRRLWWWVICSEIKCSLQRRKCQPTCKLERVKCGPRMNIFRCLSHTVKRTLWILKRKSGMVRSKV